MILPKPYAKNPMAQAITNMTAMKYNKFPMIFVFFIFILKLSKCLYSVLKVAFFAFDILHFII